MDTVGQVAEMIFLDQFQKSDHAVQRCPEFMGGIVEESRSRAIPFGKFNRAELIILEGPGNAHGKKDRLTKREYEQAQGQQLDRMDDVAVMKGTMEYGKPENHQRRHKDPSPLTSSPDSLTRHPKRIEQVKGRKSEKADIPSCRSMSSAA